MPSHNISTRTLLMLGFFGVALLALSYYSYGMWREKNYFGTIVSVSDSKLVITDKKIGTRIILRSEKTKVVEKHAPSTLEVGDQVYVVAHKSETGEPLADVVRIMNMRR
jgi:hypothetical protein